VNDLTLRLEPCVLEIEKVLADVLVVAHQGTCRALRAYLLGEPVINSLTANSTGAEALADGSLKIVALMPAKGRFGMSESVVELDA